MLAYCRGGVHNEDKPLRTLFSDAMDAKAGASAGTFVAVMRSVRAGRKRTPIESSATEKIERQNDESK